MSSLGAVNTLTSSGWVPLTLGVNYTRFAAGAQPTEYIPALYVDYDPVESGFSTFNTLHDGPLCWLKADMENLLGVS